MAIPILVDNLIDQVRDQTDEASTTNLTDADIVQALNRAQRRGVNILARYYPDPYIDEAPFTLTGGTTEYDMPEDIYEDRVLAFEVWDGTRAWPMDRIAYRDVHRFTTSGTRDRPVAYTIIGRKIRFYPAPSGTYNAIMWYFRTPPSLTESQGRIEYIDTVNNQIHVDSIGSSVVSTSNALGSYVNLINASTGEVLATMQVSSVSGNEMTLKTAQSGRRSVVYNQDIVYSIPSTVGVDDYVCLAEGTCIPVFGEGLANFLIQYAVAEVSRRLDDNADLEQRILSEFERAVERQWAGREHQLRITPKSPNWTNRLIRPYPRGRNI